MNNNRGNNRRRGRGGNRQQGNQPVNRIDSRARGNAPQLLDKYKKLAHDAHLNGDRVQEEYFLQFADHYFRVIADQKQRQEDSRQRREERSQDNDDGDRDGGDRRGETGGGEDRGSSGGKAQADSDGDDGEERVYEPAENPFVREGRSPRGTRQRKPRRSAAEDDDAAEGDDGDSRGVDPSVLPPAISAKSDEGADDAGAEAEAKPRRRTRKPKPAGDSGEELEAVS